MNSHQFLLPKRENSKEEIMHILPDVRTQRFLPGFLLALLWQRRFLRARCWPKCWMAPFAAT